MNEIVEKRGRRSKTFDLGGGKYRLEVGGHSHSRKGGLWVPTDAGVESEAGTDADVSMNYIARSRFELMDYDIRFGKNDPVWMKIKHLPSGKTVVFKPRNNNNRPDHIIQGNKISVSQAWDGIDMEIYVTDSGVKTNYIITSGAGQRVIEFNVQGDVGGFKSSPPWYFVSGDPVPRNVPRAFAAGIMSYDFRGVPIGGKIDPSFSAQTDDSSTTDTSYWADSPTSNADNLGYAFLGMGQLSGAGPSKIWRSLVKFDLSSVTDTSVSVTNAILTLYAFDGSAGAHAYDIHRMRRTWGEATCTWFTYDGTNLWESNGVSGTTADIYATAVGSGAHSGTVVPNPYTITGFETDLADILANQALNYGWRLSGDEGGASWFQWYASSTATPGVRPKLTFDYTVQESSGGPILSPGFGHGNPYPFARGRGWK